ncbi:MAG: cation-translocating P-type ATPase [Candidatus Krumholzibacteria bacterium]|nr:cation-translocating P-type ATPase [Candidatus Krumholzibacteria bacterium]
MSKRLHGAEFTIDSTTGLPGAEAARRLAKEGFNELPSASRRTIFSIAFAVIREPMFLLLVACGAIYFVLGQAREGFMLLSFVFVVMAITFYQERKTERAIEALKNMSSPRALVIRDGVERRIAGREVVRGDIIVLAEGDRVPADGVLLWHGNLSTDESMLTGESLAVSKCSWDGVAEMGRPGGDGLPFVYSGTMVVRGQGIAEVKAIGIHTEMGKIGRALEGVKSEDTLLQRETRRIVRNFAITGLILCALVVVTYGMTRGNWLQGFLAGVTLAMAILPEEFPVVLTIFLALGAWHLSQKRVLTRHMPVIETLGSATVLCVDKTGTLTMNQMSVSELFARGESYDVHYRQGGALPETFHEIVEFSILASQRDPFDPMEKAFKQFGDYYLAHTEHLHDDWALVHEYSISEKLLSISRVWKSPPGDEFVIAAKGAPEVIADLCHFDEPETRELTARVAHMADKGLRVLGVAKAYFRQEELPDAQHDFPFEFLGLVGLADPVRPEIADSIQECHDAGVRVVMVTGDYSGTARNIAHQAGLASADGVITGAELESMDRNDLERHVMNTNIFARVMPEQKLTLVNALKANGEIVVMTGDGVNDAPALRAAHIGIAMGARGTDVAREASSLVLLDDDFSSIVKAVRMGRKIFDNLRKAMAYILAVHVPIAGLSLVPVLFGWPLVLLPVHVVFMELIIDPACSIVFEAEAEEKDIMRRPPRNAEAPLFGRRTVLLSLLQGLSVLAIVLAVFAIARSIGHDENQARALTFTTLVIANLGLIFTNRSWSRTIVDTLRSPNTALWWSTGGALAFLGCVLYVPFLKSLFRFATLHVNDLLICFAAGLVSIAWFEALKMIKGKHGKALMQESPRG